MSGQIKTATSFLYNLGHVFGFDVKATDRAGGEDGKSTISNVFVSLSNPMNLGRVFSGGEKKGTIYLSVIILVTGFCDK